MSEKKILVLNKTQIKQKLTRIAYQIWEDNLHEKDIVVAGIAPAGFMIAQRLGKILTHISGIQVQLMSITVDKNKSTLNAHTDIPVQDCSNKVVILADDVLNTGQTLAYGLGIFLNIPLKKLRTAVLVNRSHHKFPITPDYIGLELATVLKEHVEVFLYDNEQENAVYLR